MGEHSKDTIPAMDPRLLTAMYGGVEEDEIDLFELWTVIWRSKMLIISVSLVAAALAVVISLTMPNIYKSEVVLAPAGADKNRGSGGLSALGGLASMAGISLGGGGGNLEENLAILKSRKFIWQFIEEKKLLPLLFAKQWDEEKKLWLEDDPEKQPSLWDGYRIFVGSVLSVSQDKQSGLVTVGVSWTDPELAAQWAAELISRLNAYTRETQIAKSKKNLSYLEAELGKTIIEEQRQALFELISQEQKSAMFANTQSDFAFIVLDTAAVPDKKVKPKRSLIVILATLTAGMLSVLFVFLREAIRKRESEQEPALGSTS